MEYRRFGSDIVARMDKGEEILAQIKEIALKESIKSASVTALGATNDFTVGVYKIGEKKYYANTFQGNFEIVSLTGTINTMDGEFYTHIHMSAGNDKADPAGVKGKDTAAALKTIADKKASFVSRGDQSGTHKAELKLWKQSGLNPDKEAFYISAGQGMMATLNMAAEKSAYTLTDRGTWIKFNAQQGAKNPLAIVVEGDKALFNQYSVITVNPKQCPKTKADLGKKFEDWWVAPSTQKRIAEFKLEGKQLFFPNAGK